jgi:putative holliday junction resolvase
MSRGEAAGSAASITLLGFDYGPRYIGVAVGQTLLRSATPLTTLRAAGGQPDWEGITRLIAEWQPQALVVGMPYTLDDDESEIAGMAKRFARQLHGRYHLPVHMIDERLTTREAAAILGSKEKRDGRLDALAATLILQTWLTK